MQTLRILMIEDDPWLGFILQEMVLETATAKIFVVRSVRAAEVELKKSTFDFAFMDTAVTDGHTYGIAAALAREGTPFAFIRGHLSTSDVPEPLRQAPVLLRPYQLKQIEALLRDLGKR